MIGSVVDGKYEVIRLLGQGGMGAVFEVRHVDTNRRLALKVIRAVEASKQRALVLRLQREARAAGAIDSPHIGQVIDAGTDAATETPYLVMELLLGEDVQQVLDRVGSLEPDVALRIVAQACLGLEKAHDNRVVHRDVKPANLFLARQRDGELVVKVLDFGIAKLKQEDLGAMESGSLTRTGSVLGSPLYMSPEQARGAKAIDHRADLWSLGVVAYQLLTGRTPYQEIDALGELILAICSELPPSVQDFAPWVDPTLAEAVHKALALDAVERYQTAAEMHVAICAHLPRDAAGKVDLTVREEHLISPDEVVRSVAAPRLFAEMGRRPAITTRPRSQHIVTPSGSFDRGFTTGNRGDRPSAAEIEASPTLMIASGVGTTSQPGAPSSASAGTSQSGDVRTGTVAGVSRSSPAEPRRSRGPLIVGVAAAAMVIGTGVAFLGQSGTGARQATPSAMAAPAASAPAVTPPVPPPPAVTLPPAVTPPASAPPADRAPTSSSAAASARAAAPTGPGKAAPRGTTVPRAPSAAAPTTAAPAGTTGFGDRE